RVVGIAIVPIVEVGLQNGVRQFCTGPGKGAVRINGFAVQTSGFGIGALTEIQRIKLCLCETGHSCCHAESPFPSNIGTIAGNSIRSFSPASLKSAMKLCRTSGFLKGRSLSVARL